MTIIQITQTFQRVLKKLLFCKFRPSGKSSEVYPYMEGAKVVHAWKKQYLVTLGPFKKLSLHVFGIFTPSHTAQNWLKILLEKTYWKIS